MKYPEGRGLHREPRRGVLGRPGPDGATARPSGRALRLRRRLRRRVGGGARGARGPAGRRCSSRRARSRSPRRRRRRCGRRAMRSMAPASARSNRVRPPESCVVSARRTVFHRMSMSGWWLAASAAAPTALTKASAAAKSCSFTVVTSSSPSRAQFRCCSASAASTSPGSSRRLAHGCVISSGRTTASNSSLGQVAERERRLLERRALLVRLLGHLGRLVVADDRVERGDEHERVGEVAVESAARSASSPSTQKFAEAAAGVGQQRDRLQDVVRR